MPPPSKDRANEFLTRVVVPLCADISRLAQFDPSFSEKELQGLFHQQLANAQFQGIREHAYKHFIGGNSNQTMDLFIRGQDWYAAIELKVESALTGKFGGDTALNAFTADMKKLQSLPTTINPSAEGKGNDGPSSDMADKTFINSASMVFLSQNNRLPTETEIKGMLALYKTKVKETIQFTQGEEFAPEYFQEVEDGEIMDVSGVDYNVSAGNWPLHRWFIIMALTPIGAGSLYALSQDYPNSTETRMCGVGVLYALVGYVDP